MKRVGGKVAWGVATVLGCALMSPVIAVAADGWDAFVKVAAVSVGGGRWATCPKGLSFPFSSPGAAPEEMVCVVRKSFRNEVVQAAPTVSLQEALEMYVESPKGFKVVAVGPMPVMLEQMTVNMVDPGFVFIAYRLVRSP
ncbi:hypothetical protein [Ottowia sp.]|uniref:hypothetical protein n=1 Tax=Ottowia sp. TaxID=1898956 RepID=UPI0025F6B684|nr:hypothetical protein [Ottowia sp.]MBK6616527.1 hypothetical protein [Ottowia sp.]